MLWVGRGSFEIFVFIIIEPARVTAHQRAENEIDRFRNSRATSEILTERYLGGIIALAVFGQSVSSLEENFRHRLPETVNALLNIADHKKIVFGAGNRAEYHILSLIDILIFVNKNFGVILRKRERKRSSVISAVGRLNKKL